MTKKKLLNKTLALGLTAALSLPFAFSSGKEAKAATTEKPTTGSIEYSLLDDDGKTFVSSTKVVITNLSKLTGGLADYSNTWGYKDDSSGVANNKVAYIKDKLAPGKYAVTAMVNTNTTVTSFVDVKASKTATKVKAIALPSKSDVDMKKSGRISGNLGTKAIIVVKNKKTAWTVNSTDGKFDLFVPTGAYDIIVDTDNTKKNTKYSIKVQAGQNNLPFEDFKADTDLNNNLDFELGKEKDGTTLSVNPKSKEYKGVATPLSIVRAYTVDPGADKNYSTENDNIYTLIGETITKKAAKDKTVGDFSIKLKQAQPGKKIKIVIEDEALNSFSPTTAPFDKALELIDLKLEADSKAVVGKDVNIKYDDYKSNVLATSNDLVLTIKGGNATNETPLTLMKKGTDGKIIGDYKISGSSITISKDTIKSKIPDFSVDTTFDITVNATGFNKDAKISQTVKVVNAPALTASVAKATTAGVKLTATTKTTGNKIAYKISDTSIEVPKLYSKVTGMTPLTTSPTDISGVVAGKYLAVYELDSSDRVEKFKLFTLTADNIK